MRLTFCFPGGKTKALTFSYDDGFAPDERLVGIFNRHAMKGTFNLNACRCGTPEEAEVLRKRYAGHEIACHGKTHPFFERMPQMSFVEDVLEDRRTLEKLTGGIIRGMAYPFGTYDANVIRTLRALGIVYARTVKSTGKFNLPDDFLVCRQVGLGDAAAADDCHSELFPLEFLLGIIHFDRYAFSHFVKISIFVVFSGVSPPVTKSVQY